MDPPPEQSSLNRHRPSHLKIKQSSLLKQNGSALSNRPSNSHLSPPSSALKEQINQPSSLSSVQSEISKAKSEDKFKKQASRVSNHV